jgi:hypothetical protein
MNEWVILRSIDELKMACGFFVSTFTVSLVIRQSLEIIYAHPIFTRHYEALILDMS